MMPCGAGAGRFVAVVGKTGLIKQAYKGQAGVGPACMRPVFGCNPINRGV